MLTRENPYSLAAHFEIKHDRPTEILDAFLCPHLSRHANLLAYKRALQVLGFCHLCGTFYIYIYINISRTCVYNYIADIIDKRL